MNNNKYYYTFLIFITFLFLYVNSYGQEYITPLKTNAILTQQNAENKARRDADNNNQFWIFQPITNLPFQDDFSRIKSTNYNPDAYPASAKSDTVWHSCRINGLLPAQSPMYFMKDTSYTFHYNSVNNEVTKTPNTPYTLTFFENKISPNTITSTKQFWPVYDSISFNTTTQLPDTFFIPYDTLINYTSDTLHYIKVQAGLANWKNSNVFWNNTYPVNPPSIGVVTFDGIDSTGLPYNFGVQTAYGKADRLNSVPFNLSNLSPTNDSVYFSFFYQSTGLGNAPEPEDSLTLEFKTANGEWLRMWGTAGYNIGLDSAFKRKMIPIQDSIFFHKDFEFRFTNYATLSGNLDHWHIDYVRIDLHNDTIIKDITWIYPGKSLFSQYQQIPRKQYTGNQADFFKNYVRNLFNQPINVTYALRVKDYFDNTLFSVNVNNVDFAPNIINSCNFCNEILNPLYGGNFSFPITSLCARYEVKGIIQNIASEPNLNNDTLYYTQIFGDCFAYDDGSAEAAYGINSPYAQMAVKFNAVNSDTLRAIRIYFNPVVVNSAEMNQFTLVVWEVDANGKPGAELYRKNAPDAPQYVGQLNGFVDYVLDTPITISGNFFIGIEQIGATELNVGLDRNTNAMLMQYYQANGTWFQTQFVGSWMMRPVFGACQDFLSSTASITDNPEIVLYPNPANGLVNIKFNQNATYRVEVYNIMGELVKTQTINNNMTAIDLSSCSEGVYGVKIQNQNSGNISFQKIQLSK